MMPKLTLLLGLFIFSFAVTSTGKSATEVTMVRL
jgi:hypothetical protein